jgi:hypothetical protein
MTQTYADGGPLLADAAHQQPEIHPELLICAHLRHPRIKNAASPCSPDCPAYKPGSERRRFAAGLSLRFAMHIVWERVARLVGLGVV